MNIFFPLKYKEIKCEITISKFRNADFNSNNEYSLYGAKIIEDRWFYYKKKCNEDKNFFVLKNEDIDEEENYFLTNDKEIELKHKNNFNFLVDLNDFSDTSPEFRCNLKIYNSDGGFSSYQSEYPYKMSEKSGSILSPLYSLLNVEADENYIFFKNINILPKQNSSNLYLVDIKNKNLVDKYKVFSNKLNIIKINSDIIKPNMYLFTESIIGIPIYVSIKDKHISMEHTHPPHVYLWGNDKFRHIKNLKEKINEIVHK